MTPESQTPYIGYEYREIPVAARDVPLFLDCYRHFGWVPAQSLPVYAGKDRVLLQLKRNRKLVNRVELTRLQRNFESCVAQIGQMERAGRRRATVWALLAGLLGTACMAGAVFAVTGDPPRYLVMALLGVPAFGGWLLAPLVYRRQRQRQSRKAEPFRQAKYEEIYRLCEKGHSLL